MKIGFLHSVKLHLGNIANAKMYRIMIDDWIEGSDYWLNYFYGEHTNRAKLRGLIYRYRAYKQEFEDFNDYDLIFLSLNFDTYYLDWHKFVTDVINVLYRNYPILYQKEVIIGAGNEVWEKCRNVDKFIRVVWDTAEGIRNSIKPSLPICMWNQKVRTREEKEVYPIICKNNTIKSCCKYIGIQSLETSPTTLSWAINGAKLEGYEPIDVELGSGESDSFSVIKELFDIDRANQIKKVFLLTPYISKELSDYNGMFKKYALSIGDFKKDKYAIIDYAKKYKNKKEEMNKMLDEAIMGTIYKYGTRGFIVKLIQKCFNDWKSSLFTESPEIDYLDTDGKYGTKTKNAIKIFQEEQELSVDGVVGTNTMRALIKSFLLG